MVNTTQVHHIWSNRRQRFSIGMMPTVVTWLGTPSPPQQAEQCYRNDPLILKLQSVHAELRYLALGETDAGRRLAFVFIIRSGRVRFVTAYPMSPQQQEIYEEG